MEIGQGRKENLRERKRQAMDKYDLFSLALEDDTNCIRQDHGLKRFVSMKTSFKQKALEGNIKLAKVVQALGCRCLG